MVLVTGMVFTYMNHNAVWPIFCNTFEAIYSDLQHFDTWYTANNNQPPLTFALADEWANYMRTVLDSMVVNARAVYAQMYASRK
jgi:chitinase